ncbi:MAG: TolC family protein [Bacteroidales bacterium]
MRKFLIPFVLLMMFAGGGMTVAQQKTWSLEECVKYAIDNNIQIKQQALQNDVQKNSLDLAKMKLLPTVSGQASHDYSFGRALDQNTYEFYNQTIQSNYFYIGGGLSLFSGLQNYNSIVKNKYLLLAGEQDLQNIKDNVALNVALAYLQILLNKELVNASQNQLDISKQQIDKTRKMVDAGSFARGNLLQIEAQAAQEELQLINLKNQLEISYLNITQMLELKTPAGFEVFAPEIQIDQNTIVSGNIDEIYNVAEGNRPEIKSSEYNLTASTYDLKMALGQRSPRLSMNYSMNTRYTYIFDQPINTAFSKQINDNRSSGVGFTMAIPILNGWQINKNISNARINIENRKYALEATKKQLYKNIQQAYADAVASLKKYNASMKAVSSSEESFRYSEQKFNVGLVTPVDYNAAKTQLLKAQSELAQAKYEFVFKTKVLDFYKGIPITLSK